jgi:hypothetical protein
VDIHSESVRVTSQTSYSPEYNYTNTEKKIQFRLISDNPGQNICDTFNYLTKFRNIIANLENLPLTPPINVDCIRRIRLKRPTLFWGVEGGKRVNYSGLIGKKSNKGMF